MTLFTDLERRELLADTDDHEARCILEYLMVTDPSSFDELLSSWRKASVEDERTLGELLGSLARWTEVRA